MGRANVGYLVVGLGVLIALGVFIIWHPLVLEIMQ